MVAGKWRQITFAQGLFRVNKEDMQEHTNYMIGGVKKILSCVGWAGQPEEIQQPASKLLARAGKIRGYVKGGIISADCEPWVAACGDGHDNSLMRDAAVDFGVETVRDSRGRRVLGSTGLGLKIGEQVGPRTRVFLIESLRARHRHLKTMRASSERGLMEEVD